MASSKRIYVPVNCTCGREPSLIDNGFIFQLVCYPCKRYALQSHYRLPAYKAWNKKIGEITGEYKQVIHILPSYFQENNPGYVLITAIFKEIGYSRDRIYNYLVKYHKKDIMIKSHRTWVLESKVDELKQELIWTFEDWEKRKNAK